MKNLKKVLSLALALVMALSLMTTAFAADEFTDADEINNTVAVEVMSAIGVLEGSNGAFNPDGTLTREQGAKIIAYMLLGTDAAEALTVSGAPFADVAADRWSAPYIAYCAEEGILNGVGNNNYDPTGTLTALQFAKMCLCALGYRGDIEGFTGDNWGTNVAKIAIPAGLNANNIALANLPVSREDAAQIAFNTLTATLVEYEGGTSVETSDGTKITVGATRGNVDAGADSYLGNGAAKTATADMQFCERYFPTLKLADGQFDSFGKASEIWYIGTRANDYTYASTKAIVEDVTATVLASYTTPKDVTYGDLYKLGDWVNTAITIVENNEASSNTLQFDKDDDASSALTWKGSTQKVGSFAGYNGAVLNVVDQDADGKIDAVVVEYGYLGKVLKVNDATASADRTIEVLVYDDAAGQQVADFACEEFEEDDYVIAYPATMIDTLTGADTLIKVEAVEVVTGACSAYAGSATNTYTGVTVAGTSYTLGATAMVKDTVNLTTGEFNVYLHNGYAIGVEADANYSADITEVVYVVADDTNGVNNNGDSVYYVKAVTMAGEYKVYQTKVNPTAVSGAGFFMIGTDADGEYIFTAAADNNKLTDTLGHIDSDTHEYYAADDLAGTENFKVDTKFVTVETTTKAYLTANTRYIFVDGADTTIVVGGITKNGVAANTPVLVSKTSDGAYEVEAVILSGSYSAAVSSDVLYLKAGFTGQNSEGYTYDAYDMKGAKFTATVASNAQAAGFYTYTVDGNGLYTLANVSTGATSGDGQYTLTDKTATKYGTLLTLDASAFVDVEAKDAVIVDLADADIATLDDLLVANSKVTSAKLDVDVYVKDEAVVAIVVVAVA